MKQVCFEPEVNEYRSRWWKENDEMKSGK